LKDKNISNLLTLTWQGNWAMRNMLAITALLALIVGFLSPHAARAEFEIDITQGNVDPLPVALMLFEGSQKLQTAYGNALRGVIGGNLTRSGLFRVLSTKTFADQKQPFNKAPKFAVWRGFKTDILIVGEMKNITKRKLGISFRIWDIQARKQLLGLQLTANKNNIRRAGHLISDAIYQRLTGEDGYFDTRIVYVEEKGPKDKRKKRLAIMDQDGRNKEYLTDDSHIVITPRFSPTLQEITYVSFIKKRARVHLYNIETKTHETIAEFDSISFAPRYAPAGSTLVFSLAKGGRTNIYTMDLRSRKIRQLTDENSINTAPSYSPDGKYITFESDRGGKQQVYVMRANGSRVRRISFGKGLYGTPVWSPRGDLIAFTKQYKGRFLIGVMRPDGSGERILTSGFHNEAPTWSPNGRVIIFYRETPGTDGGPSIWSVDLTGYNERRIKTKTFASDPAWSPKLGKGLPVKQPKKQ
jgi:TolB protein